VNSEVNERELNPRSVDRESNACTTIAHMMTVHSSLKCIIGVVQLMFNLVINVLIVFSVTEDSLVNNEQMHFDNSAIVIICSRYSHVHFHICAYNLKPRVSFGLYNVACLVFAVDCKPGCSLRNVTHLSV